MDSLSAPSAWKRICTPIRGLKRNQSLAAIIEQELCKVEGIDRVRASSATGYITVFYRTELLSEQHVRELSNFWDTAVPSAPSKQTIRLWGILAPVVLLAGLGTKRLLVGPTDVSESLWAFKLSGIISMVSGYPALRRGIQHICRRLGMSDDLVLGVSSLFLAAIRENLLVISALLVLNFNSLVKQYGSISNAVNVELGIIEDRENTDPHEVVAYTERMSRNGAAAAWLALLTQRNFSAAFAVMLAANPRPASLTSKYALNLAEIEAKRFPNQILPFSNGNDIEQIASVEAVFLPESCADRPLDAGITKNLRRQGIPVYFLSSYDLIHAKKAYMEMGLSFASFETLDADSGLSSIFSEQAVWSFKGTNVNQLLGTIDLAVCTHRVMNHNMKMTDLFTSTLMALAFVGRVNEKTVNSLGDVFTLGLLYNTTRIECNPVTRKPYRHKVEGAAI